MINSTIAMWITFEIQFDQGGGCYFIEKETLCIEEIGVAILEDTSLENVHATLT